MGYRVISFRDGSEARDFKEAMEMTKEGMRMAQKGFERICELSEEMTEQYGERGDYGERYSQRGGYYGRDWDDMHERRYRDSRGRYM